MWIESGGRMKFSGILHSVYTPQHTCNSKKLVAQRSFCYLPRCCAWSRTLSPGVLPRYYVITPLSDPQITIQLRSNVQTIVAFLKNTTTVRKGVENTDLLVNQFYWQVQYYLCFSFLDRICTTIVVQSYTESVFFLFQR